MLNKFYRNFQGLAAKISSSKHKWQYRNFYCEMINYEYF